MNVNIFLLWKFGRMRNSETQLWNAIFSIVPITYDCFNVSMCAQRKCLILCEWSIFIGLGVPFYIQKDAYVIYYVLINVFFCCIVEWYKKNFHNWPDADSSLTPFPCGTKTMSYHKDGRTVTKVSRLSRSFPSKDSC